ncbi:MAG: hypothetical protein O9294_18160 [Cytophagales bacterium]|nr:hypothetical protein [Cytophagales bacterium]
MNEPKFRLSTKEAIESLASELNLPYEQSMQDWAYEVANPDDIESYIKHYSTKLDEDKKFVLMEIIIQAINDQKSDKHLFQYWNIVKPLIIEDFTVHEYTIYYWSCLESDESDDFWNITPLMREIWKQSIKD